MKFQVVILIFTINSIAGYPTDHSGTTSSPMDQPGTTVSSLEEPGSSSTPKDQSVTSSSSSVYQQCLNCLVPYISSTPRYIYTSSSPIDQPKSTSSSIDQPKSTSPPTLLTRELFKEILMEEYVNSKDGLDPVINKCYADALNITSEDTRDSQKYPTSEMKRAFNTMTLRDAARLVYIIELKENCESFKEFPDDAKKVRIPEGQFSDHEIQCLKLAVSNAKPDSEVVKDFDKTKAHNLHCDDNDFDMSSFEIQGKIEKFKDLQLKICKFQDFFDFEKLKVETFELALMSSLSEEKVSDEKLTEKIKERNEIFQKNLNHQVECIMNEFA